MDRFVTNVHPKVLCYDDYTAAGNSTYPVNNYDLYWHYSNLKRSATTRSRTTSPSGASSRATSKTFPEY